jgi:hypothetical protein
MQCAVAYSKSLVKLLNLASHIVTYRRLKQVSRFLERRLEIYMRYCTKFTSFQLNR